MNISFIKKLTFAAITVSIAAAGITAGAENPDILINGSCDEAALGTTGWRFADSGGWYYESENPVETISENIKEGTGALHFTSAILAQRVKLQRNVTYNLDFYIRADEECIVNTGFYDGSQDWPASYTMRSDEISVTTEWTRHTVTFECPNTQDYLAFFNLWDKIGIYVDDVSLTEKENYISRLMTGVDDDGNISYSSDYKGKDAYFGTALYDSSSHLIGFIPKSESGTFKNVDSYGDYIIKNYLISANELQSRVETVTYDENSSASEDKSVGAVKKLTLSEHAINMETDDEAKVLDAVLSPQFAYNNTVTWESSDESVVSVSDNGVLTANGLGTAVITAHSGEFTDKCNVTVSDPSEKSIKLNKTAVELPEIDSVYSLRTEDGNDDIIWKSDNEDIAVVKDGVVTAKGKGKAVITAVSGKSSAKCTVTVNPSSNTITNDTFFKDTDGNNIYSQGGGIYKFGDKYYWYGIKYKEGPIYAENPEKGKAGNAAYEAFTCYSSFDLVNWEFEGYPFDEQPTGWAGRMGVCYNENTKKYVLISQFAPGTLFATSDKPEGPFKTDHIYTGEVPVENGYTGDQTIFCDDDGKAYMICSSGNGRAHLYVVPLRESDFLDFDTENVKEVFYDEDGSYIDENGNIAKKDKTGIEGNCMFKYNDKYYFTGSDLYGWNSSRVYVMQSDSILGDYNAQTGLPYIMNGTRENFAHNSQAGFYVTVHGSEQDLIIYCGDRWSDFAGNGIGYNQWVPITMNGDTPYFNNLHQWKIDAEKGTWSVGEGNNYISNPDFEADRKTINSPAGWVASDNIGNYANSNLSGKINSGNFVWQQSAPEDYIADLSQNIEGLPDGTYTMTAWAKSSGGQNICNLYAQSGSDKYSKSLKLPNDEWEEIIVADNITVKDGKCTVGLYSDAHANEWVQIDNMRLVKNAE